MHRDHMEWAMKKGKSLFLAPEFYSLYKTYKIQESIYKQFYKQILTVMCRKCMLMLSLN